MTEHSEQILKISKVLDQFAMSKSRWEKQLPLLPAHHFKMADEAEKMWELVAYENQEFQENLAVEVSQAYLIFSTILLIHWGHFYLMYFLCIFPHFQILFVNFQYFRVWTQVCAMWRLLWLSWSERKSLPKKK